MLFQNESLPNINVKFIVDQIFANSMHEKRKFSLANAALGVVSSGSLIVHRIGHGLATANDLMGKHAVKQVDRLLSNEKLIPWDCFDYLVPYAVGARKEIAVAMDWTDFDGDKQTTIAINLVTKHGRATPLLWKTVKKSELKNNRNRFEDEILMKLKESLPSDVQVTVLADRGFGDIKRYQFIMEKLGFDFVIRFRGNISVTDKKGETRQASQWVGANGRAKTLREAQVTKDKYPVPTVVCVKAKKMKQCWCLAASNPKASGSYYIQWYAKRWGCEPQFRDTKDLHFGMGLSETRIGKTERRDRILLINAIAIILLTLLGAAGESLGMDKHLKVNTVKHRTHSLFRQGCYYYMRLPRFKKEDATALLKKFLELLEQHQSVIDILALI